MYLMGGLPTGCASYSPRRVIGPSTGCAITCFSITITSRGVDTLFTDSPVGSWKRVFFSPSCLAFAFIPADQLRGRQLHRAPERGHRAVVRTHQRRVQQIAVRQRHPLQQPRLRAVLGHLDVGLVDRRQPFQLQPLVHDDQHRRQLRDRGDRALVIGVVREHRRARLVEHQRRGRLHVWLASLDRRRPAARRRPACASSLLALRFPAANAGVSPATSATTTAAVVVNSAIRRKKSGITTSRVIEEAAPRANSHLAQPCPTSGVAHAAPASSRAST